LREHGARVLNPSTDLVFPCPDSAVVIVDGFDHIALAKSDDPSQSPRAPAESDSDEEGEGHQSGKAQEEKKEEEPL
jgi:hypothetical protein